MSLKVTTTRKKGGVESSMGLKSAIVTVVDQPNGLYDQISIDYMAGTGENYREVAEPQVTIYSAGKFLYQKPLAELLALVSKFAGDGKE